MFAEVAEFVKAIPTSRFAIQNVPLLVFAVHAVAMAMVYRPMVDPPSRTPPRSPLGSLCLTLFALLSGGTLTSLLLSSTPGWAGSDRIFLVYACAWLLLRSDFVFAALRPLTAPLLLFHNALFRPLVLVSSVAASSAALPSSVIGPVVLVVITMHGCTWLAQLLVAALEGRDAMFAFCADADFTRPSMGLRTTVWVALAYRMVLLWLPSIVGVAHVAVVIACVVDCVLHDILGNTVSLFLPLESALAFLVSSPERFNLQKKKS